MTSATCILLEICAWVQSTILLINKCLLVELFSLVRAELFGSRLEVIYFGIHFHSHLDPRVTALGLVAMFLSMLRFKPRQLVLNFQSKSLGTAAAVLPLEATLSQVCS